MTQNEKYDLEDILVNLVKGYTQIPFTMALIEERWDKSKGENPKAMTGQENIAWIVDRMATMVTQMAKMQEQITWLIGQLMTMQNKEKA